MTLFSYLAQYFAYRIKAFFHHWYIDAFFVFSRHYLSVLREFDRILAWRVTLKNIFRPLYGDYSAIGYIFGFIFRLFRLIVGSFVYVCIFALAAVVCLAWFLIPAFVVFKIFY